MTCGPRSQDCRGPRTIVGGQSKQQQAERLKGMCECVCVHVCAHACVNVCTHVCAYVYVNLCACACTRVYLCTRACTCVYVCACAHTGMGVRVHLCLAYVCMRARACGGCAGGEEVTLWLEILQEQALGPRTGHRGHSAESAHHPAGPVETQGQFKQGSVWSGACFGKLTLRALWRVDVGVAVRGEVRSHRKMPGGSQ